MPVYKMLIILSWAKNVGDDKFVEEKSRAKLNYNNNLQVNKISALLVNIGASALSLITTLLVLPLRQKRVSCTDGIIFKLPESDNTCNPSNDMVYDLVFMSPNSNVGSNLHSLFAKSNSYNPIVGQNDLIPLFSTTQRYVTMVPNTAANVISPHETVINAKSDGPSVRNWYDNSLVRKVINMCPQIYKGPAGETDPKYISFSGAVSLPLFSSTEIGVRDTTLPKTKFWVIPGDPFQNNPENFPIDLLKLPTPNINSPASLFGPSPPGLSTILYFICLEDSCVYIDLGGARGGKLPLYSTNLDTNGNPIDISQFEGGSPGTIFGTLQVKKGDVLKVYLGSIGDQNVSNIRTFENYGQGGSGTFLGGAFGGGASYIVHYQFSVFGFNSMPAAGETPPPYTNVLKVAMEKNFDPQAILVCVAGGGGGSSRNASGGCAGLWTETLKYGQTNQVSRFGSCGGISNEIGPAPIKIQRSKNDLSGGGAVETVGGASAVSLSTKDSGGQSLSPFLPGSGGGSVYTEVGSGGGGGGGGYFGGGSGGFNNNAKPNNLHGAGGGGSSWNGTLQPISSNNINLNIYRNDPDNFSNVNTQFYRNGQSGSTYLNDNGYIVFGVLYSKSAK